MILVIINMSCVYLAFFFLLRRTKNKVHRFMLLLIWVMSTLWTYLLIQVQKTSDTF